MPAVDILIESRPAVSTRARQVCSMFDVPPGVGSKLRWKGLVPIEDREWSVGLIVGPSGCGKSTIARQMFGDALDPPLKWEGPALIDDFDSAFSVGEICAALSAVGFNTISAWLRPFEVLSNGEKFRATMARRILEGGARIAVDEFTSVVDRQVAQIASHAVQRYVRRQNKQFVAVSCHHDVIDWLQPDWTLEPATMTFTWRSVQPRPPIELELARIPYETWRVFAPYHYLTADLHRSARLYGAHQGASRVVAVCAVLHFPHPRVRDIWRVSRLVTLPDWQGVGIAFALLDDVASAAKAIGFRLRTYPAHPALIRSFQRHRWWRQTKEGGTFSPREGKRRSRGQVAQARPCAVFEWCGAAMPERDARLLLGR